MKSSYASLEEAVLAVDDPRGERPFRCHVHDDGKASASVNIRKMLWVCYTCHAKGRSFDIIESDFTRARNDIHAMLDEDSEVEFSESMLTLFTSGDPHPYWKERFRADAIDHFDLGTDPVSGRPCYPMRMSDGSLVGMVMRNLDRHPKYKYPKHCKAHTQLWNYSPELRRQLVLVEGAMDAISAWEVGVEAFGIYGSNLSDPQVELICRTGAQWVHLAFDNDDAGRKATASATAKLERQGIGVTEFPWRSYPFYKDVAELPEGKRRVSLTNLLVP